MDAGKSLVAMRVGQRFKWWMIFPSPLFSSGNSRSQKRTISHTPFFSPISICLSPKTLSPRSALAHKVYD